MGIVGVGIDLVSITEFAGQVDQPGTVFSETFTPGERRDASDKSSSAARHLAARWAAKEAVIKALYSLGREDIFYPAIEILNDGRGVPCVRINTDDAEKLTIKLSLSHSSGLALAFCIITGEI